MVEGLQFCRHRHSRVDSLGHEKMKSLVLRVLGAGVTG